MLVTLLVGACSLDLAELEGSAVAGQDQTAPIGGASDGGAGGDTPPFGGAGAGDGDGDVTAQPFEPTPAPEGVTCGLVGLPCCRPDNRCDLGACLRGECSAFAGAYANSDGCLEDACTDRDPYSAGCGCPLGFTPQTSVPLVAACQDGSAARKTLSVCQADRTDASGWGGYWIQAGGPVCNGGCQLRNLYTEDCTCPEGMAVLTAPLRRADAACPGDMATLGVCMRPGLPTGRFAGGFVLAAGSGNGCASPNPETGQCTCPDTATEQRIALGGGVILGLCAL